MAHNLVGYVSGFLTVKRKLAERDHNGRTLWEVECSCGNVKSLPTYRLTEGKLRTCGKCEWHISHKEAYNSWTSMNQRCMYQGSKDYPSYGGIGIKVCKRWFLFQHFLADMGDPPKDWLTGERMSLDRVDNSGDYEPNNCRWATRSQQQLNKGNKIDNNERQEKLV